jgi:hypothetical protein
MSKVKKRIETDAGPQLVEVDEAHRCGMGNKFEIPNLRDLLAWYNQQAVEDED